MADKLVEVGRLSLMRAILTILFFFAVLHATSALHTNLYVGYDFSETRLSETDHRECSTEIFLTADDYLGYRYREEVFGSTTPTVRSIEFSNEYNREVTVAEKTELVRALLAANVFQLTSDPRPASNSYSGILRVRINTNEMRTYFYTPPESAGRKAVHDVMVQFAKQVKIDQPADPVKATTISEGDHELPRVVKLADILAKPEQYHGKRVSVLGFYHREFESSRLAIDQATFRRGNLDHSLWLSGASTFADKSEIRDINDSWLRVEGVFLRGPAGHLGLSPGEIVRLTRIERVSEPK